jgi:hypothetical protein
MNGVAVHTRLANLTIRQSRIARLEVRRTPFLPPAAAVIADGLRQWLAGGAR